MFSGLIVKSCNSASSTTEHCSSKIMRTLTKSANNREKFSSGGYKRASARQNVIILADETLVWARIGRQRLTLGTSFFFFFPSYSFVLPNLYYSKCLSFLLLTGCSSFQTTADMPAIFHSHFSNWWWHENRVINDRSIGKSWPFPLFAYNILSHSKLPLLGRHEILRKKNVNDSIIGVWTVNEF